MIVCKPAEFGSSDCIVFASKKCRSFSKDERKKMQHPAMLVLLYHAYAYLMLVLTLSLYLYHACALVPCLVPGSLNPINTNIALP
jgi:predicted nucleic acid-binding Zn ribbon protein